MKSKIKIKGTIFTAFQMSLQVMLDQKYEAQGVLNKKKIKLKV